MPSSAPPEVDPVDIDAELAALEVVVRALAPLTDKERRRVLDYVRLRFGVTVAIETPLKYPPGAR